MKSQINGSVNKYCPYDDCEICKCEEFQFICPECSKERIRKETKSVILCLAIGLVTAIMITVVLCLIFSEEQITSLSININAPIAVIVAVLAAFLPYGWSELKYWKPSPSAKHRIIKTIIFSVLRLVVAFLFGWHFAVIRVFVSYTNLLLYFKKEKN